MSEPVKQDMKKLYIIKTGTTFPATAQNYGDFDTWTASGLKNAPADIVTIDVLKDTLPETIECAGVVITGSHSMVTDNLSWSVALEKWISSLLEDEVPILGICYGHQLLARAAGGEVGYHPLGKEIGTVTVNLVNEYASDPVFSCLPSSFSAHTTHAQTVLRLPDKAVKLAENTFEPNHIFRIGPCAYGVQFHPEYSANIMKSYIQEQSDELIAEGRDIAKLMSTVEDTPVAALVLKYFCSILKHRTPR